MFQKTYFYVSKAKLFIVSLSFWLLYYLLNIRGHPGVVCLNRSFLFHTFHSFQQATEVKAYLYTYLGKFRSKPEYTMTPHPLPNSKVMYIAEMHAISFTYVGKGCAGNKKDAQTRAAWDFVDYLIRCKKLTDAEVPNREVCNIFKTMLFSKSYVLQLF